MKNEKTIITVSNSQSPYFKEKGKVLAYLPQEKVEVFLLQSEIIVVLSQNDISEPKTKAYAPKSRKDFYEYILNPKISRVDITKTAQEMVKQGTLKLAQDYSEETLVNFLNDSERDRHQLVEEFRQLRDQGYLEFTLVNNHGSYNPSSNKNPNQGNYSSTKRTIRPKRQ